MIRRAGMLLVLAAGLLNSTLAQTDSSADAEAAYTRAITERAHRITATLELADAALADRVQAVIASQYRNLREIHDARDAAIAAARMASTNAQPEIDAIRSEARARQDQLHTNYIAELARSLDAPQIDRVKDGMTYGVLDLTYNAYLKMFPEMSDDQKAQIRSWLVEARELAMDEGTAREKHAVFGKYKGRINNYLVRAGYDLKEGEQNLKK